jgi:protein TonB
MESKQNPKHQVQRYRSLILATGLIISLTIVLMAFEYKSIPNPPFIPVLDETAYHFEEVQRTIHNKPKPPQPKNFKLIEVNEPEEVDVPDIIVDVTINESDALADVIIEEIPDEPQVETTFLPFEDQASFKGGRQAWAKFLTSNLKYPIQAQRMGIEGRVTLSFIVSADGRLSDIEVLRGIGAGCDEEAIRVLQQSPLWNPGKQRGIPVNSRMQMNIVFKLR